MRVNISVVHVLLEGLLAIQRGRADLLPNALEVPVK